MSSILSIAPYRFVPPSNGGHWGVYIVDEMLSLNNRVVTLTVDTTMRSDHTPFKLIPELPSHLLRYFPFRTYPEIKRQAENCGADFIFCHHHYMFPSAYKAAKALKIPCYIRSHNIEGLRFKSAGKKWWPLMKAFEEWSYQRADKVFFVTEEDRQFAIQQYKLNEINTVVLPFGINFSSININKDYLSKAEIAASISLKSNTPWFFFMGKLDYLPNNQAVEYILEMYPLFEKLIGNFKILICGENLPDSLVERIHKLDNIHYLGFVQDIASIVRNCDAMINPVLKGGGVKTKVVESLANNCTVISTFSGALGMELNVCGDKLIVVADNDREAFVHMMKKTIGVKSNIPTEFYEYYSTVKIAERVQKYF